LRDIDVAVVGGGEAPVNRHAFTIFSRVGLLSTRNATPERACRPFDATRDGVVLGEGAAALVLERLEYARRRNARLYGEVLAIGVTNDADNLVAPASDGAQLARAMQLGMEKAGVSPAEVDYISAHGTSTVVNDRVETVAIKKAFGEHAYRIPISATKSMLGHTLGACASIEVAAALMAMQHQFIPPTINLNTPDPECDLDYVPNVARDVSINVAMINNLSFGGRNSSILLKRP
jgi:3-oxoacyl-[acyl-carrier-protein] synthase II